MAIDAKTQLKVLQDGISELISEKALLELLEDSLAQKKPLVVKAGFDPSSPDIHFGHTVLLNKLRQFQDFGHQVVFIIGDATARIGDPTGRNKMRPKLSAQEIKVNAKTYQKQAYKILTPNRTTTVYNNTWFSDMEFSDMMDLAAHTTVSQIIQRDDFQKRLASNSPLSLLELFYPLMQAYDSVQIKSDIELGGTDQKFNLLLGRELQKGYGQKPQIVITLPLLVGLDGTQKMSKSIGNHIGIEDNPNDMFGKVMSISDELMLDYYTLLTDESANNIKSKISSGELHPKQAKINLAHILVTRFHDAKKAEAAAVDFQLVFSKKDNPSNMPKCKLTNRTITLYKLLTQIEAVSSGGEARRMVKQNAVSLDGQCLIDPNMVVSLSSKPQVLKVGKRKFFQVYV